MGAFAGVVWAFVGFVAGMLCAALLIMARNGDD